MNNLCNENLILILIFVLFAYLLFQINNVKNSSENFGNALNDTALITIEVVNQISNIYQADVQAIRNLSAIAKGLTTGNNTVIPGAITISGQLTTDNATINNLTVTGNINGLNLQTINTSVTSLSEIQNRIINIQNNIINNQASQQVYNNQASQLAKTQASQLAASQLVANVQATNIANSQAAMTANLQNNISLQIGQNNYLQGALNSQIVKDTNIINSETVRNSNETNIMNSQRLLISGQQGAINSETVRNSNEANIMNSQGLLITGQRGAINSEIVRNSNETNIMNSQGLLITGQQGIINSEIVRNSNEANIMNSQDSTIQLYNQIVSAQNASKQASIDRDAQLRNGLLKYYRFDIGDINNGRLVNWATGNPVYDATAINGATINALQSKVGTGCLYLNGNSQYIQLDPFTINNNGITIACWFNFTSGGWTRLFDFGNGPETNNFLYSPGNGLSVLWGSSRATQPGYGGYNDSKWHFFVWTLTNNNKTDNSYGTWNVYMDNSLIYTNTNAAYPLTSARNANYLGLSNWAGDGYSTGYIDDFRYYTRVLSTAEITQLYNLR